MVLVDRTSRGGGGAPLRRNSCVRVALRPSASALWFHHTVRVLPSAAFPILSPLHIDRHPLRRQSPTSGRGVQERTPRHVVDPGGRRRSPRATTPGVLDDQAHDQAHDQGDEYDVEEEEEDYDEDEIEEAEDYRDKWRYTFYTVLVFIILGNPYLYSFLDTNLGKILNKSTKSNSNGIIGFVVCAIIFTFTVRWMMDLDL